MPYKLAPPPHVHHAALASSLPPAEAQHQLKAFIAQTTRKPYLHPDSLLSASGVQFPPTSGPPGGLALHHLRRIAEGLGGVNLVPETREELARFGLDEDLDAEAPGDDGGRPAKRKRSRDDVERWAEETSSQAAGAVSEVESFAVPDADWEDKNDFELGQSITEGEIGERNTASVRQQGGAPPQIQDDKQARKAEKAARKLAKRREKANAAG